MTASELQVTAMVLVAAYAAGATPFGYLAGKLKGIDIREHGSGNIGATNVIRVLGKGIGIPVFVVDMLKGLVPVVLAGKWAAMKGVGSDWPAIAGAAGAVLGHNFTFWLGFRGGKGIATSAGALMALLPVPLLVALGAWLAVFFGTRYVALASIASAVALPAAAVGMRVGWGKPSWALCGFAVLLGALAIWRHRSNIRRLRDGTENRFERKRGNGEEAK